jgi:hypothetical protein
MFIYTYAIAGVIYFLYLCIIKIAIDIKQDMEATMTLKEAEEQAALQMINFAKSSRDIPSQEELDAVNNAMKLCGCVTKEYRRIEAQFILRDCITRTDRDELRKIETALNYITIL